MSWNSFGHLLRVTTWGESHGPSIGAIVDGCPPRIALEEGWIQQWLDQRRPGQSAQVSPRQEPDRVRILSGVFDGRTTGTPISLMIDNVDARPSDYLADSPPRIGHADAAYQAKYGIRDHRGGGRASARETAVRVAAGAIARLIIPDVSVVAKLVEVGGQADNSRWEAMIDEAGAAGDSLGGVVECVAGGVPAGWGAPLYAKLDAQLAAACMGINAVKGVEIGEGFAAAQRRGSENLEFATGSGVDGGISTGHPIRLRVAFKPTSSIGGTGRHDPCVAIRGAPVVEAMVALVLADQRLLHRAQCG
ncbi:MAG TPA: chorismate synthase [Sphingomicrobium sp.]|nr:chorismate synthase [Sphingomicrobium sp.]